MDDSDSSLTRKRPRLDSGARSYRSMSADELANTPSRTSLRHSPSTPAPYTHSTGDENEVNNDANVMPSVSGTPSKVTINVRDPAPESSPPLAAPSGADGDIVQEAVDSPKTIAVDVSPKAGICSPDVISVSSSASRSPEIEVAEIEDMGEEQGETRWRSLGGATEIQRVLLQNFPYAVRNHRPRQTVDTILIAFDRDEFPYDSRLFQKIAHWIEEYLETTKTQSSRWWDMYSDQQEFWDRLPLILNTLVERIKNTRFGNTMSKILRFDKDHDQRQDLEDFLVAFAALTARMVQLDCQTLDEEEMASDTNTQIPFASEAYLKCLSQFNSQHAAPSFWATLRHTHQYDFQTTITAMTMRFVAAPQSGFEYSTRMVESLIKLSSKVQSLLLKALIPLDLVNRIMQHYCAVQEENNAHAQALLETMAQIPVEAQRVFHAIDDLYQNLISKQMTALSSHVNSGFSFQLASLLSATSKASKQLIPSMSYHYPIITDDIYSQAGPTIVDLTWKLLIWRKCLMEGRMELRVQGVESLQRALVEVFEIHMHRDGAQSANPVAQHVADLLLANKVVEYLVGVDSHPQLISRSGNIVGFLVITHRYRATETDAIWRTVTSSQDSQTVDAVLTMLNNFVGLADYDTLLYLTTKLNQLSLQSFDESIMKYGVTLLLALQQHWKPQDADSKLDMPPYQLCIRTIREAAANHSLTALRKQELNTFGTQQIQILLQLGPSEDDRKHIFEECVNDIRSHPDSSTGSVWAICALVGHDSRETVTYLANQFDLTKLVVGELAYHIHRGSFSGTAIDVVNEHLVPRLNLLEAIVRYAPDSLDVELGQTLWNSMLGQQARYCFMRDKAWIMLARATLACSTRNSFIDNCISLYLPKLDPAFFATCHALEFVDQVIRYESRLAQPAVQDEGSQLAAPSGKALLWHLASVVPSGSIELQAIHKLVSLYLDSPKAKDSPRAAMEATHVEVVDRCISQLSLAATSLKRFTDGTSSGEDEPMVVVASEDEIQAQRLSFSRSLLILKEFVRGARSRPMYSPLHKAVKQLPPEAQVLKGEPLQLRYQSFHGGYGAGIQTIEVGDLESMSDLFRRLASLTNFQRFAVIAAGQKLDLEKDVDCTLRETKMDQKGLLIVKKIHDDSAPPEMLTSTSDLMPMQGEIMKHFSKLHPLLGVEDELAQEVFNFLATFPPHESVAGPVCAKESRLDVIFPRQSPFMILYAAYALKSCLLHQLRNGTASQASISHGVRILSTVVTTYDVVGPFVQDRADLAAAAGIVDCLLAFLKEPISTDLTSPTIVDATVFVERLFSCLITAQSLETSQLSTGLMINCCAVLLEASIRSSSVWENFKATNKCDMLFQDLLLTDRRLEIREATVKRLKGIFSILRTVPDPTSSELGPFMWKILKTMIPQSLDYPEQSQQLFDLALTVFPSLDHMHRESQELQRNIEEWSHLLFSHKSIEVLGSDKVDWVAHGLISLLQLCMQLAKDYKKPVQTENLMDQLFENILFPPISVATADQRTDTHMPILHTQTRQKTYSILLTLGSDVIGYKNLIRLVKGLLPEGEHPQAWSWGIAQLSEEYPYEANWNIERARLVRSPTGYPGLKNLSNTCYMNSLFTQLFMNVDFRRFILSTDVTDGEEQQKLLHETKTLFASMQEMFLKSVDPQAIADSINTYDNAPIDVSVQMDVDEFYNLLFDRWESQILSETSRKQFRSFYGGQIVQQIKSKECHHISERLEPFSAIQCDIKGKRSLKASLDAYVTGEVMEGDNKYSCTSCGSYVDAEKRACLRDIPNNLIFHLKRFDYDLMSGLRSKINDKFEFPEELDMAPYHVDNLRDSDRSIDADVFELVGILVHSGTAESGHYYSYIRERPLHRGLGKKWVEYNDADLAPFDPSNIPDQCFGGEVEGNPYATYSKQWNAYCLFYQRRTSIAAEVQAYQPHPAGTPVKTEVSIDLYNRIVTHNELFARRYCLLDPSHAPFVKSLLEQLRLINDGSCSELHHIEKEAIWLALEHLNQVFSRTKESVGFHEAIGVLTRVICTCAVCCKIALDWVSLQERNIKMMLIRCPALKVRRDFATMIASALHYLRSTNHRLYGLIYDENKEARTDASPLEAADANAAGALLNIVQSLKDLRYLMPTNSRGWDDYYGLLVDVASLGSEEAFLLLREGFLASCLEYLVLEHSDAREALRRKQPHYGTYLRLIEKGRKYSFNKMLDLLRILLEKVTLTEEPVVLGEGEERQMEQGKAVLTRLEDDLIRFGSEVQRPRTLVFLEKMLTSDHNRAAERSIVRTLVLAEPALQLLVPINKTIQNGINVEPATLAIPYLEAALVYCEVCPTQSSVKDMLHKIAVEVDTIGVHAGQQHLDFFSRARRLANIRIPRGQPFFTQLVLLAVPHWAPALLMYWEEQVRHGTIELLQSLVFDRDTQNMDDEAEAERIERIGRELCMACVKRVQNHVIQERKAVEARQVEQVDQIISYCTTKYCSDEGYRPHAAHAEAALDSLRTLAVSDIDDVASDAWNNDLSDNASDSESSGIQE